MAVEGAEQIADLANTAWRRIVAANALCAAPFAVLIVLLGPLFPGGGDVGRLIVAGPLAVGVFFVLGSLGTRRQVASAFGATTAWIGEGRSPTDEERGHTIRLSRRLAVVSLPWWWAASLALLGVVQVTFEPVSWWLSLRVVLSVLHAGVVVCTLSYLLLEEGLRPLLGLVLEDEEPLESTLTLRSHVIAFWLVGSGLYLLTIAFIVVTVPRDQIVVVVLVACVFGMMSGGAMAVLGSRAVTDPLAVLRRAMSEVGRGSLDVNVPVDDAGDLGRLQVGFNQMVAGLRERERMRDVFGRLVGTEVADRAVRGEGRQIEEREVSVLFVDLIGSTSLMAEIPAQGVVDMLGALFEATQRWVTSECGAIHRFHGDGALCVFNAPDPVPDHAARALRAAAGLRRDLDTIEISGRMLPAAVGVSTGRVLCGDVGPADRYEYATIGDAVNEAARLSDAAKLTPGRILVSDSTIRAAPGEASHWALAGELLLRGRHQPTVVHSVAR